VRGQQALRRSLRQQGGGASETPHVAYQATRGILRSRRARGFGLKFALESATITGILPEQRTTYMNVEMLEKTGSNFSHEALMAARKNTKEAIALIAHAIKPGMLEEDARHMAKETLDRLGSQKGWHKILIRFGANTIKNFEDPSERGTKLADNDIFFIDIGPVWGDTEGDGGETFVVGQGPDPDMKRCAEDVKKIFHIVRKKWLESGMSGKELYDFANKTTADMGWILNMELTGHRLSEFPHSAYYDGTLAAVSIRPSPNLWVLEVQVKHPTKPFGGFFEDLLLSDSSYA
jgi:Metallopeptidase family M24